MSEWLTLKEASALLGVHPSTLRRWSDAGKIETIRTRGGHRRFRRRDIEALIGISIEDREAPKTTLRERVRHRHPEWGQALGAAARKQARELGQRLLGLLMQFLLRPGDEARILQESRSVGYQYGRLIGDAGFSLLETVEAFLYFRRQVTQMAVQLPSFPHPDDTDELRHLHERLDQFMNEVLLGTVEGYEQTQNQ